MRRLAALVVTLLIVSACSTSSTGTGGDNGGNGQAGGGPGSPSGGVTPVDDGNPTTAEQAMAERINRARRDPDGEAARFGIDLNEGLPPGTISSAPKPPLPLLAVLVALARAHSQDMLDRNFFAHDNPDGASPFDRMDSAGYDFTAAGENLAFRGTTGGITAAGAVDAMHANLFIDDTVPDRGHRQVMLGNGFAELGVGMRTGPFRQGNTTFNSVMLTCEFGNRAGLDAYVFGVVYRDVNGNGEYDPGEGRAGERVTLDGAEYITRTAGGFAFRARPGSRRLICAASERTVVVGSANLKVDCELGAGLLVR